MAVLEFVQTWGPLILAVCVLVTASCDLVLGLISDDVWTIKRTRKPILGLICVHLVLLVAQLSWPSDVSKGDTSRHQLFILSLLLLHTAILLHFITSSAPPSVTYLTAWLLSVLTEAAPVLSRSRHVQALSLGLQVSSLVSLLLLTTLTIYGSREIQGANQDPDKEPLLASQPTNIDYDSSRDIYADGTSSEDQTGFQDRIDDDNESVSSAEDAEEAAIRASRKEKLQQTGGLLKYLASFKIFLPFIFPRDTILLQVYIAIILLNVAIMRGLNILYPALLGRIIDKLSRGGSFPALDIVACVVVLVLLTDMAGLSGVNLVLLARLAAWSRQKLTIAAFDKIMALPAQFHDSKDSGDVIKAVSQAESLSESAQLFVEDIIPAIADLTIAMWYVYYLFDAYATLMVMAVMVLFTFASQLTAPLANSARRVKAAKERAESDLLFETISNWQTVTYFNRRKFEVDRLQQASSQVRNADVRSNDWSLAMFAAQEVTERLGLTTILLLAAYRVYNGSSTVGDFVAIERYWSLISQPLYNLGYTYKQSASHLIDAERLLQLLETENKVQDWPDAPPICITAGKVEFDHVSFAYESTDTITLSNIDFEILSGQTVALVGATGSGKSTITKLLMRLYDVTSGRITIDGQDISRVSQRSLRDLFGFVPQDSVLFNTTILENVRYGRLNATDQEVYDVCKAACIHEKIMALPAGYHSKVGDRGVKLSGGERQRVAIARVLLKGPPIVVLDEATSAMDSETESRVQKAIRTLCWRRTAIVIAHRLSTVIEADVILVMDGGRIVDRGTHHELLQRPGTYQDLWHKQGTGEKELLATSEIELDGD